MSDIQVAIVGGGMTGLSTAFEVSRRGVSFILLERTSRFGGVIRTDEIDGFTVDGGPDSLLIQKPAAIELCCELGLGDRLVPTLPPRTAFVLRNGRLQPLPESSVLGIPTRIGPLFTSRLLTPVGKFRLAMDLVRRAGPTTISNTDESVASFFNRRFGPETVAYIAEPLLAGIHAGDVDRLSMRALFPRLVEAERSQGSVIRAFRSLKNQRPTAGLFRSLPGGIEELTRRLVQALPQKALRCQATVTRIDGRGPFQLTLATGAPVTVQQLVLTPPAYVAAELLAPLDHRLSELCAAIPYTSTATVALAYPRTAVSHPLRGAGFVVPRVEPGISIMAGSWVSSKWPRRAPDGQVLIRCFVGGARDPNVLERTDAELVDIVHRDLETLLGIRQPPQLKRVYRWPRLNPQHEVGHLQHLAAIDERLAACPDLQLAGSAYHGVGIPDCVAQGRAAGAAAAARASLPRT